MKFVTLTINKLQKDILLFIAIGDPVIKVGVQLGS